MCAGAPETACRADGYRHEALFYAGDREFLDGVVPFVRDGVAAGEPVLVVVSAAKIAALREALGADAAAVDFALMEDVGANPARIIAAWQDFLEERCGGRPARGVGEPIHPSRSPAELAECHRHEALLNLAFADSPGLWLLCPYDTSVIAPEVVAEARRTHPVVTEGGAPGASPQYLGVAAIAEPFGDPLPEPPSSCMRQAFDADGLGEVRRRVAAAAEAAELPCDRREDVVLAASEIATNSVRHGGGGGELRTWTCDGALVCEIRDRGCIDQPLVGRLPPSTTNPGGRGVWLANQLCDLVQIRALRDGGVVRLHMRC